MPTLDHLIDMLDRAYQGKICSQETWDMEIISQHTAEILKRYDLRKTCDKENPINSDDSLADRFFQAGVALATVTGMYCIDTERVIVISEEEIADAIIELVNDEEKMQTLGKLARSKVMNEHTVEKYLEYFYSLEKLN